MLKPEECKPGVEVIAIKNYYLYNVTKPNLSIGMIYTIESLNKDLWIDSACTKSKDLLNITLMEVVRPENSLITGYAYFLDQFKLRNIEEFTNLFKLNEINIDNKQELETI